MTKVNELIALLQQCVEQLNKEHKLTVEVVIASSDDDIKMIELVRSFIKQYKVINATLLELKG